MIQNIEIIFVLRENKKMTLMYWIDRRNRQVQIL